MLQCVAVCCTALQRVAVRCSVLAVNCSVLAVCCVKSVTEAGLEGAAECCSVMQCVAVCCSVLHYVSLCGTVLHCVGSVLHCVGSVLHCVVLHRNVLAVCCSMLQCVVS